jgi:hypothetical protein
MKLKVFFRENLFSTFDFRTEYTGQSHRTGQYKHDKKDRTSGTK